MKLEITRTTDGSDTLYHPALNQHFHSTFGAVEEALHIFIGAGFLHYLDHVEKLSTFRSKPFKILEVGFGTGLNTLLTWCEADKQGIDVVYTAIEAFPLEERYWRSLNYPSITEIGEQGHLFEKIHLVTWNAPVKISPNFTLHKIHQPLELVFPEGNEFDIVYFDAFGPDAQPEMWSEEIFRKIEPAMTPGGLLVTYSVKGTVVRALKSVGFITQKLPGPTGKRHILRAFKHP